MSKDYRFNKKEHGYDEDSTNRYNASSKQAGDKQLAPDQKPKTSFKRVDKRSVASLT